MKKFVRIVLAILVLLLVNSAPGYSHGGHFGHGGGRVGIGISLWPGWFPGWWGPYPYYPYYAEPRVVVQQAPEAYVREPQSEAPSYWYFCREPEGYYPYVKRCPNGWLKVVPSPPAGNRE
jgi:hypothetical protein